MTGLTTRVVFTGSVYARAMDVKLKMEQNMAQNDNPFINIIYSIIIYKNQE